METGADMTLLPNLDKRTMRSKDSKAHLVTCLAEAPLGCTVGFQCLQEIDADQESRLGVGAIERRSSCWGRLRSRRKFVCP